MFAVVLVKHRNVIIKEGVSLDPNATPDKSNATQVPVPVPATASLPKVIRTDLEAGKSLAPPVSV